MQGCEPRGKLGSHISCSQEWRRVWGNEPSHSQMNSHFGSWGPNGVPNLQRAITWVKIQWIEELFNTIRKILERTCLKWARMTHLDIWNTSYGQKKSRESNWQFDSQSLKVGIAPISSCAGGVQYIDGKLLTRAKTLL